MIVQQRDTYHVLNDDIYMAHVIEGPNPDVFLLRFWDRIHDKSWDLGYIGERSGAETVLNTVMKQWASGVKFLDVTQMTARGNRAG